MLLVLFVSRSPGVQTGIHAAAPSSQHFHALHAPRMRPQGKVNTDRVGGALLSYLVPGWVVMTSLTAANYRAGIVVHGL